MVWSAGKFLEMIWNYVLFFCLVEVAHTKRFSYEYVTCGSVLKLLDTSYSVRLHSHDVKYGSGSGQQSVTAVENSDDHNSYWRVRAKKNAECMRGTPIKCGQTIRLTHQSTGRNLHSHNFQSPLSHNLEVSAFGEEGVGDDAQDYDSTVEEGDNWSITCGGRFWRRDEQVRFKHVVTNHYLHVTGDTYGRPISGQKEVCGFPMPTDGGLWRAAEGIYIKPADPPQKVDSHSKDEL